MKIPAEVRAYFNENSSAWREHFRSLETYSLPVSLKTVVIVWMLGMCMVNASLVYATHHERELGAAEGYPIGNRSTFHQPKYTVGSYSHACQVYSSRPVPRGDEVFPFKRAEKEPGITYRYDGKKYTLDNYLDHQQITGLLIIKKNTVLVERYQYGRTDKHRFISLSMAKTFIGMLVGIALAEGKIASLDDTAEKYVPLLSQTPYGGVTVRQLLRMSSGVKFIGNYEGNDDVARLWRLTPDGLGKGGAESMLSFSDLPRESAPGVRFNYSDIETQILGLVLRAAVGTSIAQYMREKLWQPMGAEADACWLVDNVGQEAAYCCFNATLRDYGRFGILLSNDGTLGEKKIVPNSFVIDATSYQAHPTYMRPGNATPYMGYGYQTWIFPGNERSFALIGTRGQSIFVHPDLKLIMVQTAVWQKHLDKELGRERIAFWLSLVANFR